MVILNLFPDNIRLIFGIAAVPFYRVNFKVKYMLIFFFFFFFFRSGFYENNFDLTLNIKQRKHATFCVATRMFKSVLKNLHFRIARMRYYNLNEL